MTDRTLLQAVDLVKHFDLGAAKKGHRVRAVDGVSFQIRRGETLGIVGESGCGKTTVARLLMLLDQPDSGRLEFDGEDVTALDGKRRQAYRRRVQMVFQNPDDAIHPRHTIARAVSEPWAIHRGTVPRGEWRAKTNELLGLVGLGTRVSNSYPHQLSGGQRQRASIARALALEPEIVILDESVSALDVSIQAQIVNLLSEIQHRLGLGFVFISHDLSVVRSVADRVAVMYLGKIVEVGPTSDIFLKPSHPYTKALLSAIPVPDPSRRGARRRILLAGDPPSQIDPPSGCHFRTRCFQAADVCAVVEPDLIGRDDTDRRCACHFAIPEDVLGLSNT